MAEVTALSAGEVLVLRSPFDPHPLHRVMEGRGFARCVRRIAPDDFETDYWRSADAVGHDPVEVDVRGLAPPEPMERTLAALDELPPGGELVQVNDRVPVFLLELLDDRGDTYVIDQDERGTIVRIRTAGP